MIRLRGGPRLRLIACLLSVAGGPATLEAQVSSAPSERTPPLRAIRITQPLRIDGALNESAYEPIDPIRHFIQADPDRGAPATERTEAWVFFNDYYLYIVGRCRSLKPEA